jgi:hypothetical protein
VCGQMFKASADTIAVAAGLEHRLLPHRKRRLSSEETNRWNQVREASGWMT